jgi:hypothetical protein
MHKALALLRGFEIYNLICVSSYDNCITTYGDGGVNYFKTGELNEERNYYYIDVIRSGDGDVFSYLDNFNLVEKDFNLDWSDV